MQKNGFLIQGQNGNNKANRSQYRASEFSVYQNNGVLPRPDDYLNITPQQSRDSRLIMIDMQRRGAARDDPNEKR
jgi:hypothetical protein